MKLPAVMHINGKAGSTILGMAGSGSYMLRLVVPNQ